MKLLKEDYDARRNLLNDFVREVGIGYEPSQGKWVVLMAARPAQCGNGILDEGELCDDGNGSNFDCCSAECQVEKQCTCSSPDEFNPSSKCHRISTADGFSAKH